MAAVLLEADDLAPFAEIEASKAEQMIADAIALAILAAPCLADEDVDHPLTAQQIAAAKAILRAAVLRWNDTGTGAMTQQSMGTLGATIDTRQTRKTMFWPSEIDALQEICKEFGGAGGGAFSIDTAAPPIMFHSVLCGWAGGGCTCGVGDFDNQFTGW